MSTSYISLLLPLILGSGVAFAGPDDQKCQQESKKAAGECEAAGKSAMAQNNASSTAAGAAAGTQINKNSGSLQNEAGKQAANLDSAKKTCEQKKKECEDKCKQAKDQAKQKAQQKESMQPPQDSSVERGDEAKIPSTQQKECVAPIMAMMGQLDSGSKNLGQDGKSAGDTKDASQNSGMPPMQPPQSGGGDKKDDTPTTTATTGTGLACDAAGSERFSDCNDAYAKKCTVDMTAAGCLAFSDRYCNLGDSSGLTQSPMLKTAATTNLVVDKKGEGIGQSYCSVVNAYRFCQVKGREACPSCLKMNGADSTSSDSLARAAGECPSDPAFIAGGTSAATIVTGGTPSVNTGTGGSGTDRIVGGVGGGGSGSSGGGGGSTAGGGTGQTSGVLTPESVRRIAGTATGGGSGGADGGGGGGSTPWTPPDEEKKEEAAAGPETAGTGIPPLYQPARDVAAKASPGLFVLGSRAYTTYCTRSQIKSCK